MFHFFAWYFVISLLGLLTFPLTYRLFPALADRGYTLSRALGLLLWGYLFWILASLGVVQNDLGGLLLALSLLLLVSGWAYGRITAEDKTAIGRVPVLQWLETNRRLVVGVEILFFLAFAFWAFVRASNPNIETAGGEKTMELAFINAILRSPTFPPHDPWLSGYAISYYYFGYVMTAMLAKITGTLGGMAHNLMSALIFALSVLGAYGILYNLLTSWRRRAPSLRLPLLGPLFLLLVANFEGFLEILHRRGIFWKFNPDGTAASAFWKWLDIAELRDPPLWPLGWTPQRYNLLWRASRVIMDCNLSGSPCNAEVIDEFPAFSFLLGDLHPHVLALPFGLLAIQMALNLFLGGWKGETRAVGIRIPLPPTVLVLAGLVLGGLAFLNTWDILPFTALFLLALFIRQARTQGWGWERLEEILALAIALGGLSVVFYLPFYAGFSSQAGGLLPNLISPTRGAHLWVVFGSLLLPIFAYLIYLWRAERRPANALAGVGLALGLSLLLWGFSWLLAGMADKLRPGFISGLLQAQGTASMADLFSRAFQRRLSYIGGWVTLAAMLTFSVAFLAGIARRGGNRKPRDAAAPVEAYTSHHAGGGIHDFVLLFIVIGGLLVLAPDYLYLRDLFGYRLNTVFKFYFQAWILWSIAAALGTAVMLQNLRRTWGWVYRAGLAAVLVMALCFIAYGLPYKTNHFQISAFKWQLDAARQAGDAAPLRTALSVWTLDGTRLFNYQYPDDAAAARWLASAPLGVVAEAVGLEAYSDYGRMAAYSGQPAVLGWWWHEYQWRGTLDVQVSPLAALTCRANFVYDARRMRSDDVACLYRTGSWEEALAVIEQYHIRYIVVGTLERRLPYLNELQFQRYLVPVFRSGDVVIYEVPDIPMLQSSP